MALNSQVRIQRHADGTDDHGQPSTQWADVCTAWADIRHPSGTAAIQAGAEVSTVKASIKVRRRSGIAAGMRALHHGAVYTIAAVLPDEIDRQYLHLVCELAA